MYPLAEDVIGIAGHKRIDWVVAQFVPDRWCRIELGVCRCNNGKRRHHDYVDEWRGSCVCCFEQVHQSQQLVSILIWQIQAPVYHQALARLRTASVERDSAGCCISSWRSHRTFNMGQVCWFGFVQWTQALSGVVSKLLFSRMGLFQNQLHRQTCSPLLEIHWENLRCWIR